MWDENAGYKAYSKQWHPALADADSGEQLLVTDSAGEVGNSVSAMDSYNSQRHCSDHYDALFRTAPMLVKHRWTTAQQSKNGCCERCMVGLSAMDRDGLWIVASTLGSKKSGLCKNGLTCAGKNAGDLGFCVGQGWFDGMNRRWLNGTSFAGRFVADHGGKLVSSVARQVGGAVKTVGSQVVGGLGGKGSSGGKGSARRLVRTDDGRYVVM